MSGGSIEAILTLDASGFHGSLETAETSVKNFIAQVKASEGQIKAFGTAIEIIGKELMDASGDIIRFNNEVKGMEQFNKFSNGVKALAQAIQILGSDASTSAVGVQRVINIIREMEGAFSGGTIEVKGLASALRELRMQEEGTGTSTQKMDSELKQAKQDLMNLGNAVQPMARVREQADMMKAEFQRARQELMNFARYGVQSFNEMDASSDRLKAQMESMNAEFERSKAELLEFARYGRSQFEQVTTGAEKLATAEEKVVGATNQATQSLQKQSSASRQATASTEAQTQATNRLGKAMSSLRMIGTMVASMMVYNFAHNLITATRETVNAKSEMEGYFKMLHFSDKQIAQFNNSLDKTVDQFKRINKYALGETISSIGVEFNLTTKEMEKAMPVVSMITSEYLRAGRNVNEASLAVKDILQGEFQRLSRETGVKGDQLKEAGWSGDKKDVMGLLEALDTVGKSRNWDVFVTKANSLNDAVLILQNRFSEWSAEMVNVVQPTILGVFNTLMMFGGLFGNVMSGVWEWLNGDGIANQVVKWTGLATAIASVTGALIHYRTGANLVQMVQMGLRGSITATVFGLKAEEVALYGSRNALISRLTSLKAEQVATMGVRRAILTKILGLKAEMVANNGLKGAILSSVGAKKLEEATNRGATISEKAMIVAKHEEQVANMSTLKTIFARITGVNMETFAEKGLIVALAERIATSPLYIGSLKAEEIAELSTAEAGLILAGTLLPLTAILVGLAVAVYGLVKPLQDASEQMKSFNNLIQDGDNIIKSHKSSYDSIVSSYNSANEELQGLEKNSKKYLRVQDKVTALEKDKKTAYENWQNSIKAVEMARSRQAKYDEEKSKIAIHNQTLLADAYIKAGISSQEAMELTSHELNEAEKGAEQLRKALQRIKYEADRGAKKNTAMIDMLDKYGLSKEKIKQYGKNMSEAQYKITEGLDKFMTSDDWMERITGWLELQQGRLEEWWTELNAFFEVRDWGAIRDKLFEGLKYVFTGFGLFDWMTPLKESIDKKGIWGTLMEWLWGEGDSDGVLDIIGQWANDMIVQPLGNWIYWFVQDPIKHLGEMEEDFGVAVAKALFGKQSDGKSIQKIITDWFNNEVVPAIGNAIKEAFSPSNILNSINSGIMDEDSLHAQLGQWMSDSVNSIDILGFLDDLLVKPFEDIDLSEIGNNFIENIKKELFKPPSEEGQENLDLLNSLFGGFIEFIRNGGIGQWIQEQIGDWNLVDAFIDAFSNNESSDSGSGSGIAKKITADNLLTNLIDLSGIGTFIDEHIVRPFWDWLYQQLGLPLGQKVSVTQLIESIIEVSGDAIATWVSDNIINPLKDSVTQGILNTPVLGDVASFLGLGEEPKAEAEVEGQAIGTSFNTGIQTGLAPVDGIINNAFKGLNLDSITSNFTSNTSTMVTNATSTATNVGASFVSMKNNHKSSVDSMVNNNTTAFRDMQVKSNTQMLAMRDSTSNVTHQMTNAWTLMKDSIVASATKIKNESKSRFDTLGQTIGGFYRKIQNPSLWGGGAGYGSTPRRVARNPSVGKALVRGVRTRGGYAGGLDSKSTGATMSVAQLKKQLCPSGDCGSIFDGYKSTDEVNVWEFLQGIGGNHGLGGWNFAEPHNTFIKNKSDAWGTAPPIIDLVGGIHTSTGFKVGEFNNGTPKVSFSTFEQIATAIFSRIPYRLYFDSSWKGSWLGALQSGACNCYDGALALMALASTFGFSTGMGHGTWTDPSGKKTAHVWAIINGVKMDTTGMQQRGTWRPSASAGGSPTGSSDSKTVNVTVDMQGATIYGVDDLDSKIQESVQKGLQAEFNDPYTITI